MHWKPDGAALVGNGSSDCLANPPGCVGRELVAAAVLELVHRPHQADVALLDQVEKLKPMVGVFLGNRHHQSQVGLDELVFGLLHPRLALHDFALRAVELLETHAGIVFQTLHVGAMLPPPPAVIFLEFLAARALNLLFEVADPAVKRAHSVHGFTHAIDQACALEVGKTEVADDARNPHDLAAQIQSAAAVLASFLSCWDGR